MPLSWFLPVMCHGPSFRFSGRETSRRNPGTRFQGHEATNSGVWNECFPAAGVAGSKEDRPCLFREKGGYGRGLFPLP
ncbi:hypothetical protein CXT87_01220 [Akkermansia muciniphila]|nr:hypothetical protein CXT93_07025 [Akkermansia muciniphila]PND01763.1 hypothetical protein CXT87_01220 [Akkermansia muciniphila]PND04497.1 hypothetical protein CXT86_07060 [Akkermansia muciniphila]PND10161.1 hypothetical protein CXT85_05175 [Akkermansia muciniphila]